MPGSIARPGGLEPRRGIRSRAACGLYDRRHGLRPASRRRRRGAAKPAKVPHAGVLVAVLVPHPASRTAAMATDRGGHPSLNPIVNPDDVKNRYNTGEPAVSNSTELPETAAKAGDDRGGGVPPDQGAE